MVLNSITYPEVALADLYTRKITRETVITAAAVRSQGENYN